MSEVARAYYADMAKRYNLERVPGLLVSGKSEHVYAPSIAVHHASSHPGPRVMGAAFGAHMNSLRPYTMAIARAHNPSGEEQNDRYYFEPTIVWEKLRPTKPKLRAGHLFDFRIEALAPGEVPSAVRTRLRQSEKRARGFLPLEESEEAYALVSAAVHAGRNLGRAGCVGELHMLCTRTDGVVTSLVGIPRLLVAPLVTNELLVKSALGEARAIARIVAEHETSQPPFRG